MYFPWSVTVANSKALDLQLDALSPPQGCLIITGTDLNRISIICVLCERFMLELGKYDGRSICSLVPKDSDKN